MALEEQPTAPPHSNWERANRWLTLGANIGVVLGLIILIVEVRQNAAMTRLAQETGRADMFAQIELSLATPAASAAWMKAIHTPETLTDSELRMAETQLVGIMQQWTTLFSMEQEGLVERARVRIHIENTAPFYFGSAFAKRWWEREEIGWTGTSMYEVADPIIKAIDPDFLVETYAFIRAPFTGDSRSALPAGQASKYTLVDMPRETIGPGIVRQHVHGFESTFSRWEVEAGGQVPMHSHHNEQVTLLLSGSAEVMSDEQRITLKAGDMLTLPPNVPHGYTFTEKSIVIEFFAPRRQDWIDAESSRPQWAPAP
jgi:quercetin dioxygenase-like cupin family protein